jgi:hypothetical protein
MLIIVRVKPVVCVNVDVAGGGGGKVAVFPGTDVEPLSVVSTN